MTFQSSERLFPGGTLLEVEMLGVRGSSPTSNLQEERPPPNSPAMEEGRTRGQS